MRQPGIEPGSNGWEPSMITTTPQALGLKHVFNLNPQKRHQEDSNFRGRIPSRFLIYRLNHSAMVPKLKRSYRDLNPDRRIQSPKC